MGSGEMGSVARGSATRSRSDSGTSGSDAPGCRLFARDSKSRRSSADSCTSLPSSGGNWSSEASPRSSRNWRVVANKAGRPTVSRWPMTSIQPRSSSCLMISELIVTPRMSSMSPRVTGWR
ncbi:hypothetical protein FQZ97_1142920 [compost metagenome]